MKPQDLKPPFKNRQERRVMISDRVWYVPEMDELDREFTFPGWCDSVLFGNSNPVSVEYCSGNGDWIIEKAKENPHMNWVAVEVKFMRVRKIWSKLKNNRLNNLIVICGEGLNVTRHYFPGRSVKSVFVNFPDPWPKRRHAKHRIIQEAFVKEISRITEDDGYFTLVTDDAEYSRQMIGTVMKNQAFASCLPEPHYKTDIENYGSSYFYALWNSLGRVVRYHQFQKSGAAA